MRFSQNDLITVSREVEVDPGVIVGGARYRVYGTAPTYTPSGNSNTSGVNTGSGGVQSVRAALRYATVEIPSQMVFGMNDREWEDLLRDTFQADELTIAGTFSFAQGGTHVDGTTGPVITATAGTFDDLRATGDFAGLMMELSGVAVHADNKWPRAVKDLKPDGSQIDVEPLYASALAGAFRSQLHDETGKAGTIRFGRWVRNRGVQNIRSVNFEWDFTDQPAGSFAQVVGAHASTGKLNFTGKGNVDVDFMYEAMDYLELATASAGSSVNDNPYVENEVMSAGEDLAYFAIGGTTLLSAANLTSFQGDFNGSASGADDVSGNRFRAAVTVGDIDCTGNLKVYHDHALSAVLATLGRSGNKAPIDFKLVDPDGNFYWGRYPKALFDPNMPKPGAKGSKTDSQINFKTQMGKRNQRTFILQRFAASA